MGAGGGTSDAWPLAGLRVLDLGTEITSGYAAKLFVDAGADVVVVEPPGGDPLRRWTASHQALPPGTDGVLHGFLRASTRSVVADLATDAGRARVLDLAARADVVLADRPVSELDALGLGLGALQAAGNPALVLVTTTPWGGEGPYAGRPATEFTVQAACGSTAKRGLPEREPVSAGGRIGEWLTAAFTAVGALTGRLHARRTGQGQVVDVSMLEALTLCLNGPYQAMASQWFPDLVTSRTIEVPSIEAAADGAVGFCTQTAQQWQDFTVLIGHPELGEDPALRSADQRMAHRERIGALIAERLGRLSVDEAIELAVALRVPVAPVGNGETVTGIDHLVARGVYRPGPGGTLRPRPAFLPGSGGLRPPGVAPVLGADRDTPASELWPDRPAPTPVGADPASLPLAGLRVVDLTAFWAGPFATTYLAALGADVVKVESTKRPDGIRFLGGFARERSWEWSMVFAGANPGKRDLTLDLEQEAGRALLTRLVEGADVVIENWSARVLDGFGFGWDRIRAVNPRAILVRMPAFGLDGPWRDRTGFAMTIEQVSGLAWVTGYEDLPLVPRGPCDPLGGMHAVFALLCALEDRRRTGRGQLVEVPLVEAALNIAAEQVLEHQAYGVVLGRSGNRGPYAAPQGLYPCSGDDRWLAVAVVTDEQWRGLCEVLGPPGAALAADPALASAAGRRAAHDRVDEVVAGWTAALDPDDAERRLLDAGVPASVVWPGHRAHLHPQLTARRFLQPLEHPVTGPSGYPSFPMQFSAFGPHLFRAPPPTLGQHNDELLAELGVPAEEQERLRVTKVVGDRPNWL